MAEQTRRDAWWLPPLATGVGLTAFGVYALVAAIQGSHYLYERGGARYLSPFYSPDLQSLFGSQRAVLVRRSRPLGPARASPARVTTIARRTTARSSGLRPPAPCRERARRYTGETAFPLVLQNAAPLVPVLRDRRARLPLVRRGQAFVFRRGDGASSGSASARCAARQRRALSFFTLGCHSLRHLVGGNLECYTCSRSRGRATGSGTGSRSSTQAQRLGVGQPRPASASPTSTSGSRDGRHPGLHGIF